jgi:hypothetical protein
MVHLVQHGDFHSQWRGDVLIVTYTGSWNLQAVQALHASLLPSWQARAGKPWAMLTDASRWEGGTPEVLDEWWLFFEDAVKHGMSTVTDILPSHFHALVVQALAERASKLAHYQRSQDIKSASAWLAQQGFNLAAH